MKKITFLMIFLFCITSVSAQSLNCTFTDPILDCFGSSLPIPVNNTVFLSIDLTNTSQGNFGINSTTSTTVGLAGFANYPAVNLNDFFQPKNLTNQDVGTLRVIATNISGLELAQTFVILAPSVEENSTIINSNITNSPIENSTIINSGVINSIIENSNVTNSTVINSSIDPSNIVNSIIINGIVINSQVLDSSVFNALIIDSLLEGQTIIDQTIINNVVQEIDDDEVDDDEKDDDEVDDDEEDDEEEEDDE